MFGKEIVYLAARWEAIKVDRTVCGFYLIQFVPAGALTLANSCLQMSG